MVHQLLTTHLRRLFRSQSFYLIVKVKKKEKRRRRRLEEKKVSRKETGGRRVYKVVQDLVAVRDRSKDYSLLGDFPLTRTTL